MERIQSVNVERIQWACSEYGIAPEQLAPSAGVPESTTKRSLAGDRITFKNLQKIAKFLGHGALFFVEQGPIDEANIYTPQFRTILNKKPHMSAKLRQFVQRVEKQREAYIALQEAIDEPVASFSPPDIDAQSDGPKTILDWLDPSTSNSFAVSRTKFEQRGILVFLSNGYIGKRQIPKEEPILGFSIYHESSPVIVVKKGSEQRQPFTLMHELAHLLIHKTSWVDDENDLDSYTGQEREASALSGHVLVPDTVLESISDDGRPNKVADYDQWLATVRQGWGVSGDVILRRLLDSDRLTQENYTEYRDWKESAVYEQKEGGNRKYRHREPVHIFGDGFVRTVLRHCRPKRLRSQGQADTSTI